MGVKERREKEKERLRNSILDAANELFQEKGYKDTKIRDIAKLIEYNPATIYFYYKNKEEIFLALQARAFNLFYQSVFKVAQGIENPATRMQKMGKAYINFALKNPALYDLMFILKQPMNAMKDDEEWNDGKKSYDMLKHTVKECMDEGYLKAGNVESMAYMIWSAMHGMVCLPICNRMPMVDEDELDFMIREAFIHFNQMLFSMKP